MAPFTVCYHIALHLVFRAASATFTALEPQRSYRSSLYYIVQCRLAFIKQVYLCFEISLQCKTTVCYDYVCTNWNMSYAAPQWHHSFVAHVKSRVSRFTLFLVIWNALKPHWLQIHVAVYCTNLMILTQKCQFDHGSSRLLTKSVCFSGTFRHESSLLKCNTCTR